MSKYDPLRKFLENSAPDCDEIKLGLKQIEIILRADLPKSAGEYPAWWRDPSSHPHVRSWMDVGWKVSTPTAKGRIERVVFTKEKK